MSVVHDPILRGLKSQPLSGLSGASIHLVSRDGRRWFVRKAVSDPAKNERMKLQVLKQRLFAERLSDAISVPEIFDEGTIDGRYYFDMEYVQGPDGVSFLRRASYPAVAEFSRRLAVYLEAVSAAAPVKATPKTLFLSSYEKLCQIQSRTNAIPEADLADLFIALQALRDFDDLPQTLCHGDCTLENLIVREDGRIVVLDFLDAPYEHYWQDIAKLNQDLSGGWYTRRALPVAQCVLEFVQRRLMEICSRLHPAYERVHPILMAMVFARILPYVGSAKEREFVVKRISFYAQKCRAMGR